MATVLRLLTLVSLLVAVPSGQVADPWAAILEALRLPALATEILAGKLRGRLVINL